MLRNNAEIIDAKTRTVERLTAALERIAQYEYELEGTAATWKDIATGCRNIALQALHSLNKEQQ